MSRFTAAAMSSGFVVLVASVGAFAQFTDPGLGIETVVSGLESPTAMAFIGEDDFLVLQKNDGRVLRVIGGVLQPGEVLDLAVHSRAERGLLGIAIDPDFQHNDAVYLYFTESATGEDTSLVSDPALGHRLYRYRWDGASLVEPRLIYHWNFNSLGTHNGGPLRFGRDDRLYVMIGDSGTGDPGTSTPSLTQNDPAATSGNDLGVVFRIDRDGNAPPDNPFYDPADANSPFNRYYAYGIRNSFGMAVDPLNGEIWATENGPLDFDELNHVVRGFNGGWYPIHGPDDRDPQAEGELWLPPGAVYRDPELSWLKPVALTATAFVASRKLGCGLEHDLLVGDYACGQIYRFELDALRDSVVLTSPELQDRVADNPSPSACVTEVGEIRFAAYGELGRLTDIRNGPDGLLYLVLYQTFNPDLTLGPGSIVRVAPVPGAVSDADGDLVADSCDCSPSNDQAFATPREVPRIRVAGGASTSVGWDSQRGTAGDGTGYRMVSGTLIDLRSEGGFASACSLAAGLAVPASTDGRTPPAGDGFYYLTRAENVCGSGTFGDGTAVPDARDALDLSTPNGCP